MLFPRSSDLEDVHCHLPAAAAAATHQLFKIKHQIPTRNTGPQETGHIFGDCHYCVKASVCSSVGQESDCLYIGTIQSLFAAAKLPHGSSELQ